MTDTVPIISVLCVGMEKKLSICAGCQLNLGCFCHKKDPSSWHEIGGKKGLIFEITLNKVRRPVASIIIQLFTFQ